MSILRSLIAGQKNDDQLVRVLGMRAPRRGIVLMMFRISGQV